MIADVRVLVPLLAVAAVAQDPVAERLASLSLEQKVGQLFVAWTLSRVEGQPGATNHDRLLAQVRDGQLGGVILSLGTAGDAAALVGRLQAAAPVPLLIAGDFEGGVWFRLQGGCELGNQMLVGATGSAALAEAMGRVTGDEAKALGCHWVFAPVLDVNSNPQNPIINVRSFGEDAQLVARLGCAFARGVREAGLLPCGKHFPGHGDVATDSHLLLPTVAGDAERLRAVELLPFAEACREGLESVMTGHLAVPALAEAPDVPATLSERILRDVLRDELGFTGLVVTDALDMGGVKNAFPPGEVAVRALLAGADVLLMPPDPAAARGSVVDAVRSGRVPGARLDDAVRRLLQAKAKVGLLRGEGRVGHDWPQRLRSAAAEQTADTIAARGLTLVRDRDGVLPLTVGAADDSTVLVTLLDQDDARGAAFAAAIGPFGHSERLTKNSEPAAIARAAARVAAATTVVLSLHVAVREASGGVGVPAALQPVLAALAPAQRVVAVAFGSPYVVQHLPHADVFVAAYASTARIERAAAAAVRGEAALVGRVPVTIPGVAEGGTGLTRLPGRELAKAALAAQDLDPALPDTLREVLGKAIAARVFPGAVCMVARRGACVAEVAAGRLGYDEGDDAVTVDTRYDLASLTKVCATTPAVLRLCAAGKLSLDDPVTRWVPAFAGGDKERVTVRQLLAHQGGLRAHAPFHATVPGKEAIVAAAAAEPLAHAPGSAVLYSDLGFVLLMVVVERASGEEFAAFVQREVLAPFAMTSACFVPIDGEPIDAAPTEMRPARGGLVRGLVHDENAFAMGGVSGHAGLFATARDVLRFGVAMLAGGRGVLPRALVDEAIQPVAAGADRTRGIGFQLPANGGWGGTEVPPGTFGHTGFTGTSLWCDPRHDLCIVLLTNRVHPTRTGNGIQAARAAVHDAVLAALR